MLEPSQQKTSFVRGQLPVQQRGQLQAIVVQDLVDHWAAKAFLNVIVGCHDVTRSTVGFLLELNSLIWPHSFATTIHQGVHFQVDGLAGPEDARTYRADRTVHLGCDLLVTQSLDLAQGDRLA